MLPEIINCIKKNSRWQWSWQHHRLSPMTPKGFFCPNTIEKDPWGSASGQEHIHGLPKQLWETHVYIKGNLKVVFLLYCFINLNLLTNILALYTGISTPPILHRTSIWRKHNSHTLTVTQEKQCCYATPCCSKTSQSQALNFSSFRTETAVQNRNGSSSAMEQTHRTFQTGSR